MIVLLACQPTFVQAAGMVTNNTFADLQTAMEGGGNVVFTTNGTITFTSPIVVTNDTVLNAGSNSITLSGGGSVRLFEVLSNVSFAISNVTLTRGFVGGEDGGDGADGEDKSGTGGDGGNGGAGQSVLAGAIHNEGALVLVQCRFITNIVAAGFGGNGGNGGSGDFQGGDGGNGGVGGKAFGGAIYNIGSLLVTNCTFFGNSALGGDGGIAGDGGEGGFPGYPGAGAAGAPGAGGAIYSLGTARIFNSTFSGNTVFGGYSKKAGSNNSHATGNDGAAGASGLGGGIYNTGVVQVVNCTFASNFALGGNGGNGGDGDFDGGDGGDGGLGSGGGIYSTVTAAITNCTLSGNGAFGGTNGVAGGGGFPGSDGSMGASRGGSIARNTGSFVLANSALAAAVSGGNGYGTITDAGYNISSDNSVNLTGTGSSKNTDPKLGVLRNNGGPTQTMMPQVGSPIIDRITNGICLAIDQRGISRPVGPACDAGAVETSGLAIQTQPQSQTNIVGTTATFNVTAVGESPLTYQWRFNNTNINAATNFTFVKSNVQLTNSGNYRVVVSNPSGSITSAVAVLKVLAPVTLEMPSLLNETNFFFRFQSVT
jgi:hypothetical protein